MSKKAYTSKDIKALTDREHVRLRTAVYLGSTSPQTYTIPLFTTKGLERKEITFIPAVHKAIGEILDNSIDEFANNKMKKPVLDIKANPSTGEYTVADNGRGIPIDMHETGVHTPEVVLSQLRSGRNFEDEKEAGIIGQNGVGSACTNFCSSIFDVQINRDGKKYTQTFKNGAEKRSKPKVIKGPKAKTGTSVSFKLDDTVFKKTDLPEELIRNRAIELAFNNPKLTVNYNGEAFKYPKGMEEIVKTFSSDYYKFSTDNMEFFICFDAHKGIDEEVYTWVNSSLLYDGGKCNTQFTNAFYNKTLERLMHAAKKQKCVVTKNDVKQDLLILASLKITDPEYDAQSKTRLTGPDLRTEMIQLVDEGWASFARKHKSWLESVLERAAARHHTQANSKLIKDLKKNRNKPVPGLLDATDRVRLNCRILITEGESAASQIGDVRNPRTTGSYPLTGKINNVYGCTPGQLMNMGKIIELLNAIGLIPGQKAERSDLRFGEGIIIATDADSDGADIFTLLINLFFQFWPELFDPRYDPIIFRLVAPNVVASKGKKRIHFATMADFKKVQSKYASGWEIEYFKGLGSMSKIDWEMILDSNTDCIMPIQDDGKLKETLQLLFSNDAEARKVWLTT